jgi:hypothetical protein
MTDSGTLVMLLLSSTQGALQVHLRKNYVNVTAKRSFTIVFALE